MDNSGISLFLSTGANLVVALFCNTLNDVLVSIRSIFSGITISGASGISDTTWLVFPVSCPQNDGHGNCCRSDGVRFDFDEFVSMQWTGSPIGNRTVTSRWNSDSYIIGSSTKPPTELIIGFYSGENNRVILPQVQMYEYLLGFNGLWFSTVSPFRFLATFLSSVLPNAKISSVIEFNWEMEN